MVIHGAFDHYGLSDLQQGGHREKDQGGGDPVAIGQGIGQKAGEQPPIQETAVAGLFGFGVDGWRHGVDPGVLTGSARDCKASIRAIWWCKLW